MLVFFFFFQAEDGIRDLTVTGVQTCALPIYRAAPPPPPPPEPPQIADEWLPRLEPPTRHVGLNRFVWDLRYPPPPAARYGYSIAAVAGQGTVAEPEGPLVLPGVSEVRPGIGEGGQAYTRPLRV